VSRPSHARLAALLGAAAALACARALREPPPLAAPSGAPPGASADALLRQADAAWARRAEAGQAEEAQRLYLQAAQADATRADGLVGAMRAAAFRIERAPRGDARAKLSEEAVQLGQHCERRAPSSTECKYRLAIALGEHARDHTASARDAVDRMVKLLRGVAAADPRLDRAGPRRVLALVLLRAPAWPMGPGDPEQALREAEAAVKLFPDAADNQLALGEALAANDRGADARAALERAVSLADRRAAEGDPDAPRWRDDARAALAKGGHP
jgi:tetratricopeptide (TPR) repeat protein